MSPSLMINRNFGSLDKEEFKEVTNNPPEDKPTEQIRPGVKTDEITAAIQLFSPTEKEIIVLENLPTEADVICTVIVIETYVNKDSFGIQKFFNFLKYKYKSSLGEHHHGSFNKTANNNTIVDDDPEDKVLPGPLPNRRDHPPREHEEKSQEAERGH